MTKRTAIIIFLASINWTYAVFTIGNCYGYNRGLDYASKFIKQKIAEGLQ